MRRLLWGASLTILSGSLAACAAGGEAETARGSGASGGTGGEAGVSGDGGTGGDAGNSTGGNSGSANGGNAGAGADGGTAGVGGEGGTAGTGGTNTGGAAGMSGAGGTGGSGNTGGTAGSGGGLGVGCDSCCPAGFCNLDGNPITGSGCGCEYECTPTSSTDEIDPDFKDENCDGGDGIVETCIYVSASLGSDGSADGTRAAPFASINAAIGYAKTQGAPAVCVSGEIYNETVNVESGISVYGGFDHTDPNFKFRRSAAATTVVRAVGTVFYAPVINDETHIEGFTMEASAPSGFSQSTYGVRLGGGGGQLYVRYNVIDLANGTDGEFKGNGQSHAQTSAPDGKVGDGGCEGTGIIDCDGNSDCGHGGGAIVACGARSGGKGGDGGLGNTTGQPGSPAASGAPGGPGASANSCTPLLPDAGTQGSPGTPGSVVSGGGPGAGGLSVGSVASDGYSPATGGNGTPGQDGNGGGGGGGGGGGSGNNLCCADFGGGGGSGGCGGLGGNAGLGGGGGGGSFGVFAAAGNAIVFDNRIFPGNGGKGANGGNGASGQQGGTGAAGGGHSDDSGPGGRGGDGSAGGAGGPGGGGGGGPSVCVAIGGLANVQYQPVSDPGSCVPGSPGTGGLAGTSPFTGNAGTTGTTAARLNIN
ncbi:MAG: PE-PGRS family protein [Polyangiaceae bacterium]|nr:PE-PGRS family protein [Polyangiaceae bacterium]